MAEAIPSAHTAASAVQRSPRIVVSQTGPPEQTPCFSAASLSEPRFAVVPDIVRPTAAAVIPEVAASVREPSLIVPRLWNGHPAVRPGGASPPSLNS